jgi:phospholipase/lecithinase/hemolysin
MSISGNDGAALVSAYLPFAQGIPGARANFVALTSRELGEQAVNGLLDNPQAGAATVGIAYMTALATKNYNLVKSKVLDNGANKVVLANSPKLTVTPLLAFQLAALQAQTSAQAGPAAGALARAQFEGLIDTWVKSYNEQLVVKFTPEPRVVIFDLYSLMSTSATTPATYGFTNSRDASCPPTITSRGPTYDLKTCTEARANGYITSGQTGLISKFPLNGNVTGFLYSDDFHPTPKGHEVAGQLALELIKSKGWAAR